MTAAAALLWTPGPHGGPVFSGASLSAIAQQPRQAVTLVQDPTTGAIGAGLGGTLAAAAGQSGWPVVGQLPPLYPEWLGTRSFNTTHGTRFSYVQGAMANGIATTDMVIEMSRAGFLGFFGAAGLHPDRVAQGVDRLEAALGDGDVEAGHLPYGCNFIHSPNEPAIEAQVAELYIRRGVRRVSAAAFMNLTRPLVRYALSGIRQAPSGEIIRPHGVFAKISRPEVARHFMEPAPKAMLERLVADGWLTADEARLGSQVAVAEDYIVESDSGGHTDNRPLTALFPTICSLRDEVMATHAYARPIRLGAAGGIGTPTAAAAAYALGADFILTGSVNQACVESGLSERGRKMLAVAGLADVIMAPAADMFEQGVEVQVLRRGTMFAVRGKRLYELYRNHTGLSELGAADVAFVEKCLQQTISDAWASTRDFWMGRDPTEVERAERDPKHQMALLFRAYLGQSSRWAIAGVPERAIDYQIWCGPAQGAFNAWAKGSFLEAPEARRVVQVALNLVEGAATITRASQLRSAGLPLPATAFDFRPRPLACSH